MPSHRRVFWGYHQGIKRYQLLWKEVSRKSVVLISAAEGLPPSPDVFSFVPTRFVGDAVYSVENIAPDDGSVFFVVDIRWPDPLPLWTDVTLFNHADPMLMVIVPH